MVFESLISTFCEDLTLTELKEYRKKIAVVILNGSSEPLEINLKRVGDRETGAIRVVTDEQRAQVLAVLVAAIADKEGNPRDPNSVQTDFSKAFIDP